MVPRIALMRAVKPSASEPSTARTLVVRSASCLVFMRERAPAVVEVAGIRPRCREMSLTDRALLVSLLSACASSAPTTSPAGPAAPAPPTGGFATSHVALPGGGDDGVLMDYLLYDARTKAVWAPAGNTGAVDVVDTATGKL